MSARVVLVTGVSRGLGAAMVDKLVELEHTVIGCCRSEAAVESLTKRYGGPHRFRVVDICASEQVECWANEVLTEGLVPDLILNNAALINSNAVLWDVPAEEFSLVVDVNIKGTSPIC